jgi:transcriptional regulator with XRE-family HTH domain
LKAAREQQGVTLEQIAASTKISASLFNGLEANNLSRWPKGLYRRSYLRDYLRIVGLPADAVVAEFVRLFPDPDEGIPAVDRPSEAAQEPNAQLAMTFDDDVQIRATMTGRRFVSAGIDAVMVLVLSLGLVVLADAEVGTSVACVALGYYSIATASFGRSMGSRWLDDRALARWKRGTRRPVRRRPTLERLRDTLAKGARGSFGRQLVRVASNALLLRIWFVR